MLRPTTPSAHHAPHLPVWHEDESDHPSPTGTSNAFPTTPFTPPPAQLTSITATAHSVQPYTTSPFSPQTTTAHNALSATPTADDAPSSAGLHSSSTHASSPFGGVHALQTQPQCLSPHSSWQRPRRSIDTQLPPDRRSWQDAQVCMCGRKSNVNVSEHAYFDSSPTPFCHFLFSGTPLWPARHHTQDLGEAQSAHILTHLVPLCHFNSQARLSGPHATTRKSWEKPRAHTF